jgi:hypothetical protein
VAGIISTAGFQGLTKEDRLALGTPLALAAMAPLVLIAGWTSLFTAGAVVGVLAGILTIIGIAIEWRSKRIPRAKLATLSFAEVSSVRALIATNAILLVSAFAPATNWDAATAHLAVPAAYVRADHIRLLEGNVYSAYPQLLHTVMAVLLAFGRERDLSMLIWFMCTYACLAVYALAARLGGREAGLVAAAMFSTAPIYAAQAGTVAIDVPFTGFIASALLALVIWDETKRLRFLAIAGAIAGAACGIRHTGYLAVALMFAWVAIQGKDHRAKWAAAFAVSAVAASAPWWLRSWILAGNPVYPLLPSVFGTGAMPDVQVTGLLQHETARSAGLLDLLSFPWRIAMRPDEFDGWQASPGGLVLALGVVGVLTGGPRARWLGGFSLVGTITIYYVQRFARYLFPFFMPLHVTGALAAVRPGPLRRPIAALLVLSYIYGFGLAVGTTYFKWPVAFGLESREDYLTRRVERYPAFQWINAHVPRDSTVLTLDPRSYFIRRDSFQNLGALQELAGKPMEEQLLWMKARGIRYIFIPDAYVVSSPIFRERGIAPLIDAWRADARFRTVYSEDLPDPRGGGTEHVTILEVAGGDGSGTA